MGSYPPQNNNIPNPNLSVNNSLCDLPLNERIIMEEIAKNGPIVVNLLSQNDFYRYKRGVYVPFIGSKLMDFKLRYLIIRYPMVKDECTEYEWMEVNHAVLCYGWGEENGIKVIN